MRRYSLFPANWHSSRDQGTRELQLNLWHLFSNYSDNEANDRVFSMLHFSVIFPFLNPWHMLPPGKHSQVLKKCTSTREYERRAWKRIIVLPLAVIFSFVVVICLLSTDHIFKSGICPLFELIELSTLCLPRKRAWTSSLSAILVAIQTLVISPPHLSCFKKEEGNGGCKLCWNIMFWGEQNCNRKRNFNLHKMIQRSRILPTQLGAGRGCPMLPQTSAASSACYRSSISKMTEASGVHYWI